MFEVGAAVKKAGGCDNIGGRDMSLGSLPRRPLAFDRQQRVRKLLLVRVGFFLIRPTAA